MAHTMASSAPYIDVDYPTDHHRDAAKPSLVQRFTVLFARGRQLDNEVGKFIQANGGSLTDELEREISRRFGHIVGQ